MIQLSKKTNTTFEDIPLDIMLISFYRNNTNTFTTSFSKLITVSKFIWQYGWDAIKFFWQTENSLK